MSDALRPDPDDIKTHSAFARWYWPVDHLHAFCDRLGLSRVGTKAQLRARVAEALGGPAAPPVRRPKRSGFAWSRETLTNATVITADISFGPNVRRFFTEAIGSAFVCHGDFMAWVRANPGETLAAAIEAWRMMEARKDDPAFRREIAEGNNYLQYLRDLRDAHPSLGLDDAKACWDHKKLRPAQDGRVVYEPSDLQFIKNA
ncbi:MAG: DUF6434 domain-containing protein [Pseudomonadota bacterium]